MSNEDKLLCYELVGIACTLRRLRRYEDAGRLTPELAERQAEYFRKFDEICEKLPKAVMD